MASKPVSDSARRYHHGNLRQTLLDVGLRLIREEGTEAVTLRTVARRAGVSHTAPYHHFADKAALIEALAVEAFRLFTRELRCTWEKSAGTPWEGLGALGGTYVEFAVEHPEEFRLMHLPGLRRTKGGGQSPVGIAASWAYAVLRDAVCACQASGLIPAGDPAPFALTAWSGVHGLAVLSLDRLLVGDFELETHRERVQAVIRTLASGLESRPGG